MAHFAKIDDNGLVLEVLYMEDSVTQNAEGVETESVGQTHLQTHNNWPAEKWIKTSYNTIEGSHTLGGTAFRGNYAGIDYTYHADIDYFMPPKPYNSWSMSTANATWIAPSD